MNNYWKIYCVDEDEWKYTWQLIEPSTCPVSSGHATRGVQYIRSSSILAHVNTYKSTSSAVYHLGITFTCPSNARTAAINAIGLFTVMFYDASNRNILLEYTGSSTDSTVLIDCGELSNVPSSAFSLEVYIKSTSNAVVLNNVYIYS